nr:hypothetical protein [Kofleriaceae bacterium]
TPEVITDTELNVLCTPQEQWCQGMKQEFEALYGITVNYVRMSSGEALARIEAEKDNPTFDIWWGGPIDSFVSAKGKGADLDVYVNDEHRGKVPVSLELGADSYHVEVKRGKVTIRDEHITIEADQEIEIIVDPAGKGVVSKPPPTDPDVPDGNEGNDGNDGNDEPKGDGDSDGNDRDSNGDGGSAPVDETPSATPPHPWLAATAGTTVMFRNVGYTQVQTDKLFQFSQGGQILVGVGLEVWPLGKSKNVLRGLSLRAQGSFGVPQSFATADAQMAPVKTSYRVLGADVHYQLPLGSLGLDINAGYQDQRLSFAGTDVALATLPDAAIRSLRLGGGLTLQLGAVELFGYGEGRIVLGGGPYMERFQDPSGSGYGFGGGARLKFGRLFVAADVGLQRYAWTFLPTVDYIAKTASDSITGINLGLGVAY